VARSSRGEADAHTRNPFHAKMRARAPSKLCLIANLFVTLLVPHASLLCSVGSRDCLRQRVQAPYQEACAPSRRRDAMADTPDHTDELRELRDRPGAEINSGPAGHNA